ncbi:MAG: energy transducer TonB [Hymenobacter sp.]|nr:MAG: energy transducer TonB [Hymenobacter sp.]
MIIRFLCGLAVLSLGMVGEAIAQRATGPAIAAVAGPAQKAAPAAAGSAPAVPPAALFRADSIFINPQVLPRFTGGDAAFSAYLKKNIHYSAEAQRQHLSGKVFVNFVLSATGLVTYATVLHGPGNYLNEEALRLVWHMPAWQPAQQHGQPVRVSCTIPIVFEE